MTAYIEFWCLMSQFLSDAWSLWTLLCKEQEGPSAVLTMNIEQHSSFIKHCCVSTAVVIPSVSSYTYTTDKFTCLTLQTKNESISRCTMQNIRCNCFSSTFFFFALSSLTCWCKVIVGKALWVLSPRRTSTPPNPDPDRDPHHSQSQITSCLWHCGYFLKFSSKSVGKLLEICCRQQDKHRQKPSWQK